MAHALGAVGLSGAGDLGRRLLDAFGSEGRGSLHRDRAAVEFVQPEEGWSNCCPIRTSSELGFCAARVVRTETTWKGEPWPEGLEEAVAAGRAVVQGTEPRRIRTITCICAAGHRFGVRQTQRSSERGFQYEWRERR